jgi:hypothetical protein
VAATPAERLAIAPKRHGAERVKYLTRELAAAMREHYGAEVTSWTRIEPKDGERPLLWLVAPT